MFHLCHSLQTRTRWKKVLSGAITALLLVPVPVLAINFTGVTWTSSQPSFGALLTNIAQPYPSTNSDSAITFYLNNGQTFGAGITRVTSSPIPVASTDTLNATWLGLSALKIQPGSVTGNGLTITISVSNGTPNNMFAVPQYTSSNQPADSPTIAGSTNFTTGTVVVTVTFDYSKTVTVGAIGQPSTQFTLDFHN